MKIAVIIPAAGLGKRFATSAGDHSAASAGKNKIEQNLDGRPVFLRSVELFLNHPLVSTIILAVNPDAMDQFLFRWADKLQFHGVKIVPGGKKERWETVLLALEAVPADCTHIAVHDAARPLTSAKLIDRIFEAAEKFPAIIPGIPAANTLKLTRGVDAPQSRDPFDAILGSAGKSQPAFKQVVRTVDRSNVYEIQTPQVFVFNLLREAYAQITSGKLTGDQITDDAGLIEALGEPVYIVEGEATNFKITRPDDLILATGFLLATKQQSAAKAGKKKLFGDDED